MSFRWISRKSSSSLKLQGQFFFFRNIYRSVFFKGSLLSSLRFLPSLMENVFALLATAWSFALNLSLLGGFQNPRYKRGNSLFCTEALNCICLTIFAILVPSWFNFLGVIFGLWNDNPYSLDLNESKSQL